MSVVCLREVYRIEDESGGVESIVIATKNKTA